MRVCTYTNTRTFTAQINDIQALKAAGIEPKAVGWALVKVFAELMLIQGYIHGDPHPGNAMVRRACAVCACTHGASNRCVYVSVCIKDVYATMPSGIGVVK
eukprot:1151749-Pelagomonas_calceolata.AAC.4